MQRQIQGRRTGDTCSITTTIVETDDEVWVLESCVKSCHHDEVCCRRLIWLYGKGNSQVAVVRRGHGEGRRKLRGMGRRGYELYF